MITNSDFKLEVKNQRDVWKTQTEKSQNPVAFFFHFHFLGADLDSTIWVGPIFDKYTYIHDKVYVITFHINFLEVPFSLTVFFFHKG